MVATNFFDDFPMIEPDATRKSAWDAAELFMKILGWRVSGGDKSLPLGEHFEVLGIILSIAWQGEKAGVRFENKPSRVQEMHRLFKSIAEERNVDRSMVAMVLDKMQFYKGQILGRGVQPAATVMQEAVVRCQGRVVLNVEERAVLDKVANELLDALPRMLVAGEEKRPVLVFTDGTSERDSHTYGI
eukprot:1266418-Amphidinium_carterae.1